jgi:preprotein translocase subunit SecG
MSMLANVILTVQMLAALGMIGLILVQHGKGADMGAAFGGGSSGSLFGATGSANFLSRTTAVLATVFFITSLALSYIATNRPQAPASVMEQVQTQPAAPVEQAPAQPAAGADSKAKEIPK